MMLIFVVFLGLGFCGLDHCLVGNFILGTLKLLTVGGFGFWFLLDWMLIVFNCVNQYSTLSGFGWDVVFTPCKLSATHARHPDQYTVSVRFHPEEPFQKVLRSKTEAASRTLAGSARLPASSTRPSSSRS